MRCTISLILAFSLLGARHGFARTPIQVRVTANSVNVRARPSLQAETVAQVDAGDTLSARSMDDNWVEVAPPPGVAVFVHGDFMRDGVVDVARLNVRAGPGINFSDMGALVHGDRVKVIGEFADWLKIEPTPETSVWISRAYVEPLKPLPSLPPATERPPDIVKPPVVADQPPPAPLTVQPPIQQPPVQPPVRPPSVRPPPRPAPRPAPPPEIVLPEPAVVDRQPPPPPVIVTPPAAPVSRPADQPARTPPQITQMGLVPLAGQGRPAVYAGVLTQGSFLLIRPSRFRLVERGRGRLNTLCYVMGDENQLESLVGEELTMHGLEYWLQGTRHPVLVVERIVTR